MSVVVVGSGIIGLSIGWRLLQRGVDVTVIDDGVPGAWNVAAGMLAPGGESSFEPPALVALMAESARQWPAFAASLGVDVGYDDTGTLSLALTADDLAAARRHWSSAPVLRPSELREREPALSPRVRAGVHLPGDRQVDPRLVVAALRSSLGARVVPGRVTDLSDLTGSVVLAAGVGTAALTGLPIRAVKGQVLRLRGPVGLVRHVLEGQVDGRSVYIVPRASGEIVVGATQEERADWSVTAGGVYELLQAAISLVPDLAECSLVDTLVGHRPGTPDNAPLLGWWRDDVAVAAGHFRNGVLLAPITADLIADLMTAETSPLLKDFDPGRFA